MPIVLDGTNGIDTPDLASAGPITGTTGTLTALTVNSNNISAVNSLGFRNRIINGDMRIDQRNAGASVATSNGVFVTDRFNVQAQTGTVNASRSTVAPTGFVNSLSVTVATGASPASGAINTAYQGIEGFNISDLGWGTASAQSVTVSFWVRSSLTGTFAAALRNNAVNRCYVFPFTISAANTWELETITIPGDTTGTWLTDNGAGIYLSFDLGEGSTRSTSTTNTWLATNTPGLTSGVKLCATTGATFYITGVQLEAGSVATPFERVDYGRQLMMCQRYYETGLFNFTGYQASGAGYGQRHVFLVAKRATPTMTTSGVSSTNVTAIGLSAGDAFSFVNNAVATATGVVNWSGTFQAAIEL